VAKLCFVRNTCLPIVLGVELGEFMNTQKLILPTINTQSIGMHLKLVNRCKCMDEYFLKLKLNHS